MPRRLPLYLLIVGLGFLIGASETAWADTPDRVGRVAFLDGVVSLHQPGENGWQIAQMNYPMIAGSKLLTEPEARAEIDLGALALRLDGSTELALTQLDNQQASAALYKGRLALHLTTMAVADGVRVATSRGAVELMREGDYQVDAGDDTAPTQITVVDGRAQISMGDITVTLLAGQTMVIRGDRPGDYMIEPARDVADNDWSWQWNRLPPAPMVEDEEALPPILAGSIVFASSGTWQKWPDGRHVWVPKGVPAGWKPYHEGHWAWVEPWGWTWIDIHPWGFLPSHYGRWINRGDSWGWVPGPLRSHDGWDRHPAFAPALVKFTHTPSEDHPAWTPLGLTERYQPSYAASSPINRNIVRAAGTPAGHEPIPEVPAHASGISQPLHDAKLVVAPPPFKLDSHVPPDLSIARPEAFTANSTERPSEGARSVEPINRLAERAPIETERRRIEAPVRSEPVQEKQKSSSDNSRSNR